MRKKLNLVTVREAATILGMHRRTVQRLLLEGKIAGERISPKLWMIRREVLDKYSPMRQGYNPKPSK